MHGLSGYTWASKQALKNIQILSHKKKNIQILKLAQPPTKQMK